MINKNEQIQNLRQKHGPDILRAKDIIPGKREIRSSENQDFDIPRFDLAQDIMAEQRRLIALRRRGPSPTAERVSRVENQESNTWQQASRIEFARQWDPVIADIVARDIERLCGGRS